MIQGVGYALTEELIVDPTTGSRSTATSTTTSCRRSPTCPRSSGTSSNVPDENLPNLGAKGLGEPPIVPTAAAIANAFAHATGRRAAALPLTPARVLETLA